MNVVRTSPYTRRLWKAVDEQERHVIESSIPDGHFITVNYRTSLADLTIRLFKETDDPRFPERVAMREHQRDVAAGCWRVLLDAGVAVMA